MKLARKSNSKGILISEKRDSGRLVKIKLLSKNYR